MGNHNVRFSCVQSGSGCSGSSVVDDNGSVTKQLIVGDGSDLEDVGSCFRNVEARPTGLEDKLSAFGPVIKEAHDVVLWILINHTPESQYRGGRSFGEFRDSLVYFLDFWRLSSAITGKLESLV